MSGDDAAAAIREAVGAFNAGDPDVVRRVIARDFFHHVAQGDEPTATDIWSALAADLRAAFPDLTVSINDLAPTGPGLAGHVTMRGTHTAPLWDAPATGKHLEWPIAVSIRPEDGRFAVNLDDVGPTDALRLLRELDLVNPSDQMDRPPHHPVVLPEIVLRLAFTGQVGDKPCDHLGLAQATGSTIDVCQACVAMGETWPALRMCLVCGFVGCCDTSRQKHMKQHYQETGHPLFRSLRLQEGWVWCYADNAFFSKRTLDRLSDNLRS